MKRVCSFCGKEESQDNPLLASAVKKGVYICELCLISGKKILDGWELHTSLEIDGETVFTSKEMQLNSSSSNINFFLDYIKQCRILSNYLNIRVIFSSDIIYVPTEHKKLLETVRILEKREVFYKDDIKNNANFSLIINQDIPKNIINKVQSVQFISRQEEKIKLFDNFYLLPKKVMYLDSVYFSFDKKLKDIMHGDTVQTELIPAKDFKYRIEFEK